MESLQPLEIVVSETTPGDDEQGKKADDLTPTITFKDAKQALLHDTAVMRSVAGIILMIIYFAIFTAALFTRIPTARMYEQSYAVSSILATSGTDTVTPTSPMKFFNIAQLGDVYDWLNNSFVPAVFVTQDQNGYNLASKDYARIGLFNKGLGGAVIEVYRKSLVVCGKEGLLKRYCHMYESDDGYTSEEWSKELLPFSPNATEASNKVAEWKQFNLIDNSTDKVTISVLTYNGDLDGYVYTQLTLQFQLGGFVTPKVSARPTISISFGNQGPFAIDILVWLFWANTVAMMMIRFRVICTPFTCVNAKKAFKAIGFPYITVGVFIFYVIWVIIVVKLNDFDLQFSLWKLDDPKAIEGNDILTGIEYLVEIARYTSALRVVGVGLYFTFGLQILNRFQFHPQLNILTRTLGNALKQFRAFFVVFIVIFVTFTGVGCLTFGDRAKEFSSLENSMASCINMLFGEFDFDAIKDLQFSVAFFWIYMIVVSIVLMNMMLGIVLDAYGEVSKASYNKSSNRELVNHIASLTWDMICELSCCQGSHVSRGKIRSTRLAMALHKKLLNNPNASSTVLTLETLKSLFPDADLQLSESEFQATLKHVEQAISIVKTMNFKAGTMYSTKPWSRTPMFEMPYIFNTFDFRITVIPNRQTID